VNLKSLVRSISSLSKLQSVSRRIEFMRCLLILDFSIRVVSVGHEYRYSNTNPEYYSPNIRIGRFS
jgi:hypothetical protein